jgi:hypothetical protein
LLEADGTGEITTAGELLGGISRVTLMRVLTLDRYLWSILRRRQIKKTARHPRAMRLSAEQIPMANLVPEERLESVGAIEGADVELTADVSVPPG